MNELKSYSTSLSGLTFVDLFAGIGGFHQALSHFGASCVYACEWDKYAQKMYFDNYGIMPEGDITQIKITDIPEHDVLCAGFPCQPFSVSGRQGGFNDTRGTLFYDLAKIVAFHRPRLLILENVRNFAIHDDGHTLETVKRTMGELGYDFFSDLLNASDFGLAQNRERLYMVCIRRDGRITNFNFPKATNENICLADIALQNEEEVSQYIINRNDIELDLEKIEKLIVEAKVYNNPIRVGTINKGGQGERIYSEFGHAITLSAYGGGPGSKTGCYHIDNVIRKLAPRECARLQGYPDTFKITVSDGQAWKQFGNTIPVTVVIHIIKAIVDDKKLYEFLSPSTSDLLVEYT